MIMGDMKHLDAYKAQMPDFIYEVLKEASQFDFAGVPDGKYKIKGCNMNVETSPTELSTRGNLKGTRILLMFSMKWKAKKNGSGLRQFFDAGKCIESHPDRDLYFYEAGKDPETKIHFKKGRFAVFFPEDLHRPLCQGESGSRQLRKAVVKVPVEWVSVK